MGWKVHTNIDKQYPEDWDIKINLTKQYSSLFNSKGSLEGDIARRVQIELSDEIDDQKQALLDIQEVFHRWGFYPLVNFKQQLKILAHTNNNVYYGTKNNQPCQTKILYKHFNDSIVLDLGDLKESEELLEDLNKYIQASFTDLSECLENSQEVNATFTNVINKHRGDDYLDIEEWPDWKDLLESQYAIKMYFTNIKPSNMSASTYRTWISEYSPFQYGYMDEGLALMSERFDSPQEADFWLRIFEADMDSLVSSQNVVDIVNKLPQDVQQIAKQTSPETYKDYKLTSPDYKLSDYLKNPQAVEEYIVFMQDKLKAHSQWDKLGINLIQSKKWQEQGFKPEQAKAWTDLQIEIPQATQLVKAKIDPQEYSKWKKTSKDKLPWGHIKRLVENQISTDSYKEWSDLHDKYNLQINDLVEWIKGSLNKEQARSWMEQGFKSYQSVRQYQEHPEFKNDPQSAYKLFSRKISASTYDFVKQLAQDKK